MSSAFHTKFFQKSLVEVTGDGIEDFYKENCRGPSAPCPGSKEFHPSGQPKLFQKLVVFLSGLETSFKVDKRHASVKRLIDSLLSPDSAFQRLVSREYSKVTLPLLPPFLCPDLPTNRDHFLKACCFQTHFLRRLSNS